MREKEFRERLEKADREKIRLEQRNNNFVQYRLLVFLAGVIAAGLLFYTKHPVSGACAAAVFILLFILVMLRHGHIRTELRKCTHQIGFYGDFIKRIGGDWSGFSDTGGEFMTGSHPYAADLNVFGPKSLFQLINLAHTHRGRHKLAELLEKPDMEPESILKRQKAVRELSGKLDFIEKLTLEGLLREEPFRDPEKLLDAVNRRIKVPVVLTSPILLFGLPFLTLFPAIFAGRYPWLYFMVLSGLILQLLLFGWGYKNLFPHLNAVHPYKKELEAYRKLLEIIENEPFESELLKELQKALTKSGRTASAEIGRLAVISDYIDFKESPLIYFILNALVLWDLHLYRILDRWQKENAGLAGLWLDSAGSFEALASLSVMELITPVAAYPEFTPKKPEFEAKDLSHPYIPYDKRVPNDVSILGTGIITGSNMSGKTTLLRTVGINLVLAYAGAAVCARSMKTGFMAVYTSMRNNDDLSEGISTFYAELLRIRQIVDYSRREENMIFLIDELFKGTNSKDRIEGARIVLERLNRPWTIGLVSTHDYELCDLERYSDARFSNYHFTESYSNNQIHFDYKLHRGRCTTSNARYLMKMAGLE